MRVKMFDANDFRDFVNENIRDEEILEKVQMITNKNLEELIEPNVNRTEISKIMEQAFIKTIDDIRNLDDK